MVIALLISTNGAGFQACTSWCRRWKSWGMVAQALSSCYGERPLKVMFTFVVHRIDSRLKR